jgi:hypothetical protein
MTVTFDADPPRGFEPERRYRVLIEEWDEGSVTIEVKAIGPKGASVTAWQTALDRNYDPMAVLKIEEAS